MAYKFAYNPFTDQFDLVLGGLSIPQTGWITPSNYTPDRYFDASSTTVNELANVLATLIVSLKTAGILDDFVAGDAMGVLGLTYSG